MTLLRSVLCAFVVGLGVLWPVPSAAAPADCTAITPLPVAGELPPAGRLACADLRGLDLDQEQLAGADLHGSNLAGASLIQAGLTGADLHGANLAGAKLGQADLAGANLSGANLTGAGIGQTDLKNADLRGAVLTDAATTQVFLTGADLRGADLRGADLRQADLRGADLRGADLRRAVLTQAETDGALGLSDPVPRELDVPRAGQVELNGNDVREDRNDDPVPAAPGEQISYVLLGPAAAIVLILWRRGIGRMMRHRVTTPLQPARLVGGVVGALLVVTGLYLAAVGAIRGIAHLTGGANWATDPGPFGFAATAPQHQLAIAGGALVLGWITLRSAARRRQAAHTSPGGSQVAIGKPTPGWSGPVLPGPVRGAAKVLAFAGLADIAVVVLMLVLDELPASGPWQADTVVGHLVFVAVTTATLFMVAAYLPSGVEVATPSGVVFSAGGREPYLWLSGTTAGKQPASQALPWESLEQVHFIRVLGTADPAKAMITVRLPGADRPGEYPGELPVTPAQVAGLRALLPPEMITEHTRVPSSD